MATLTLRDLRKSYGPADVIKGINLDVLDREFVVFVGPSGCGKSTLLMASGSTTWGRPTVGWRWCSSPTRCIRT